MPDHPSSALTPPISVFPPTFPFRDRGRRPVTHAQQRAVLSARLRRVPLAEDVDLIRSPGAVTPSVAWVGRPWPRPQALSPPRRWVNPSGPLGGGWGEGPCGPLTGVLVTGVRDHSGGGLDGAP